MDMKSKVEIKEEVWESTQEDKLINSHLEKLSKLEEIQESNCYESTQMKSEIEVKEEHLATEEEETAYDELEKNHHGSINMKSEIEVKEEHFHIEEEEAPNEKILHKICQFDQNQFRSSS
ncbi:hypothetical protein Avbf_03423 [Armadillidium vulgare]|nr:hypothetical protein Avbf_03423 [Armadillidium vulgare]